jgi:hypothetical protein
VKYYPPHVIKGACRNACVLGTFRLGLDYGKLGAEALHGLRRQLSNALGNLIAAIPETYRDSFLPIRRFRVEAFGLLNLRIRTQGAVKRSVQTMPVAAELQELGIGLRHRSEGRHGEYRQSAGRCNAGAHYGTSRQIRDILRVSHGNSFLVAVVRVVEVFSPPWRPDTFVLSCAHG